MDGVPAQLTVDPNTGWLLWLQSTEAGGSAVFRLALSGPACSQHADVDTDTIEHCTALWQTDKSFELSWLLTYK